MKTFFGVVGSFLALVAVILVLLARRIIGFELAMLMVVALFALYVGFGFLIFVHRAISKLD